MSYILNVPKYAFEDGGDVACNNESQIQDSDTIHLSVVLGVDEEIVLSPFLISSHLSYTI